MDYIQLLRANNVTGLRKYLETNHVNEEINGQSLLYLAVIMNNQKFCKLLIDWGADVNQKDSMGRSPLSTACYFGFTAIVELLIQKVAQIDSTCMDRAYNGFERNVQKDILKILQKHCWANVYLDDLRDIPEGFVGVRTMEEAVEAIEHYYIHILSLDHDLGMDEEGNLRKTGYDLIKYICEKGIRVANKIYLHTDNVVGRENMYQTFLAAQRRGFIDQDIEIYPYPFTPNRYTGE
ncbi:cyclic-phosphate processing receiver domain-containing protein [Heyndrickxia faecalis]|uniref:cyclic-phosphate processing receiver domain-containing protein n=1 Tax=Heyndrickxia faecalis TaxID=2824910 RepID=UPI003D1DC039